MKGKVYLICDPLTENFKIGVTKRDIKKRIKELQTGNSCEIFVSAIFESNYPYEIENILHKKYSSKKTINEWFSLNINDIASFLTICEKYEKILKSLKTTVTF